MRALHLPPPHHHGLVAHDHLATTGGRTHDRMKSKWRVHPCPQGRHLLEQQLLLQRIVAERQCAQPVRVVEAHQSLLGLLLLRLVIEKACAHQTLVLADAVNRILVLDRGRSVLRQGDRAHGLLQIASPAVLLRLRRAGAVDVYGLRGALSEVDHEGQRCPRVGSALGLHHRQGVLRVVEQVHCSDLAALRRLLPGFIAAVGGTRSANALVVVVVVAVLRRHAMDQFADPRPIVPRQAVEGDGDAEHGGALVEEAEGEVRGRAPRDDENPGIPAATYGCDGALA
mmetsp:Transcript_4803/g.14007  ORF Transcript_4803/g.14007 Transcript_4803/m.14007 type:complete len:284 (+) Transcript_4803:973-1824(+)